MITRLKMLTRRLWGKFQLWLERRKIKDRFPDIGKKDEIPKNMTKMMNIRLIQGVGSFGISKITIGGDSIMHGFEPIAQREFGNKVCISAIGGNRARWIADSPAHILTAASPILVLHMGGNDLLSGDSVEDVIESIFDLHSIVGYRYPKFYMFEILPLGHIADFPEAKNLKVDNLTEVIANVKDVTLNKIPVFNARLRSIPFVEVIPVYSKLQRAPGEAWISKKYGSGDLIHVNDLCYSEVYVPEIRKILEKG